MAAEKTTKKATPKKAEIVELTTSQQLDAKRVELLEARKSLAAGELINPRVIRALRKDIARLLTTLNAQEGGK